MNMTFKSFEEMHKEGAEKFGILWLRVNEIIVKVAAEHNVNYFKQSSKETLTDIAFNFLDNFNVKEKNNG